MMEVKCARLFVLIEGSATHTLRTSPSEKNNRYLQQKLMYLKGTQQTK